MRRFIAGLTAALILSTSAFAFTPKTQALGSALSTFKEDVLVLDRSEAEAFKDLVRVVREQGLTMADLKDYVKENASGADFSSFEEAISFGQSQIQSVTDLTPTDLEVIMSQVVSMTSSRGANYQGDCSGEAFLGSLMVIGAVFLAIEAINSYDYYVNNTCTFCNNSSAYRQRDEALVFGVLAGFSGAAGISLIATCDQ